jgi:hypothetical protein
LVHLVIDQVITNALFRVVLLHSSLFVLCFLGAAGKTGSDGDDDDEDDGEALDAVAESFESLSPQRPLGHHDNGKPKAIGSRGQAAAAQAVEAASAVAEVLEAKNKAAEMAKRDAAAQEQAAQKQAAARAAEAASAAAEAASTAEDVLNAKNKVVEMTKNKVAKNKVAAVEAAAFAQELAAVAGNGYFNTQTVWPCPFLVGGRMPDMRKFLKEQSVEFTEEESRDKSRLLLICVNKWAALNEMERKQMSMR